MKITVCSPSVLRLQMARGRDISQASQTDLPGGRTPGEERLDLSKPIQAPLSFTTNLQLSVTLASASITLSDKSGQILLYEHGTGDASRPGR